ncbi:MAG TPA: hypothetical protein VHE61_03625 [Opitutaceae bacterium]|nr:hypothetical protein [Opitutaceae bacterium]
MKPSPFIAFFLAAAGIVSAQDHATSPALTPSWSAAPSASGYYINSTAISGDGARAIGGTFFHSYTVTGRDASSGTFGTYCYSANGTQLWKDEFTGWQGVYWVDISNDGAWAASGGWYSQNPYRGFVRAYNAANGQTVLSAYTSDRVNQVALSADGTWLVSGAESVILWHRVGGKYVQADVFKPTAASDSIQTIALSADGSHLVAGDFAGSVMLFSITDGKLGTPTTWTLPGGGYSHCVRINPAGTFFAAGGSSGNFYLFNVAQFLASGQPVTSYHVAGAGSVYGVAVSASGDAFVGIVNAQSTQGCVYYVLGTPGAGTLRWTFPTQHNPNSVSLNSNAGLVAVADGHPDGTPGSFYLLKAGTGTLLGTYGTSNMSWPIEIASNGSALIGGSDDSHLYYFPALTIGSAGRRSK